MNLQDLCGLIVRRRKAAGLTQAALAAMAQVSLPTLKALEQGRMPELGFSKVVRILGALNLDIKIREANRARPDPDEEDQPE
jgi:transcriptional regulator with XRE-family HTH domain